MQCSICSGQCRPLISDHNPKASEWYCAKCHKSHKMSGDDFNQAKMMMNAMPQKSGE